MKKYSTKKFKCKKCKKICYRRNYKDDYLKFCSRKCFFSYIQKPIKEKKCLNCYKLIKREKWKKKRFNYKRSKFCSQKCANLYNNKIGLIGYKPINKKCLCMMCKKEIFYHTSKKRYFCSNKCKGLYETKDKKGSESPLFGNNLYNIHKAYFVKEIGHIVRSSWEENICLILKNNNIPYKFEKKMFLLTSINATYRPDIILNKKLIISIKGFLTKSALKKEQIFRKEYPNYKYIVITHIKNFKKYNFVDKLFDYNKIVKNPLKLINYLKVTNE